MAQEIYTASMSILRKYPGAQRYAVDITAKAQSPFAPDYGLAMAVVNLRKGMDTVEPKSPEWEASKANLDKVWETYERAYHKRMALSFNNPAMREAWTEIRSREIIVLTCFCPTGHYRHCHRLLFAQYLSQLDRNSRYIGEIGVQRGRF